MKIALISPKGPLYQHKTGIFPRTLRAAPLTLTTLAALVPEEISTDIHILDEGVQKLPEKIDADIVGMTVITGSAPRAYELSARFRAEGKTVILGGPHVTLMPDEAQQHADSIAVGYAEETWPQILQDYRSGCLANRYKMSDDFDLATLPKMPYPRRDLLKRRGYSTTNTFEATRGCIHGCEFCVVPSAWGRKPFLKPVGQIIDDIRQHGGRRIIFYDLNMIADLAYAEELFTALIPLNVKWFGLSTVLLGEQPQLMELMAESGCRGLLIGFESVSSKMLNRVRKGFNKPNSYSELIGQLHALNIAINGTFVFGGDEDEKDVFDETIAFVFENKIDLPRFALLTPFPGTPLYDRLNAEGRITTRDWSLYDGQHVVFKPTSMNEDDLIRGHERVWREVYSARGIRCRVLKRMRNISLIFAANLAYRFYANNLHRFYNCTGGMT